MTHLEDFAKRRKLSALQTATLRELLTGPPSIKAIGARLGIGEEACNSRLHRLARKLGVTNKTELLQLMYLDATGQPVTFNGFTLVPRPRLVDPLAFKSKGVA